MMVVFSGGGTAGHFHPACNIAEALTGEVPGVQPYFVGTEGRIEAAELPGLGYPYRLLPVAGLQNPLGAMRRAGRGVRGVVGLLSAAAANARALWLLARAVVPPHAGLSQAGRGCGRRHRRLRIRARRNRRQAAGTSGRGAGAEPPTQARQLAFWPAGRARSTSPTRRRRRGCRAAPATGSSTPATRSVRFRRWKSGIGRPPAGLSACPPTVR